jgi:hypothetical protein
VNGDYDFTVSPLATIVKDLTWGDFDKNGTPDLVLVRLGSTDVWLNTTLLRSRAPTLFRSQYQLLCGRRSDGNVP